MKWYEILITILSGMITAIPLIVKLCEYVQKAIKEKNYTALVTLVMELMKDAEDMFDTGADRKTWVMERIEASAALINYDFDEAAISELIDQLCAMTKIVNAPEKTTVSEEAVG